MTASGRAACEEVHTPRVWPEDGYVRESSEGSGVGAQVKAGSKGGSALQAGDDSRDRQLKLVVSFDPASEAPPTRPC